MHYETGIFLGLTFLQTSITLLVSRALPSHNTVIHSHLMLDVYPLIHFIQLVQIVHIRVGGFQVRRDRAIGVDLRIRAVHRATEGGCFFRFPCLYRMKRQFAAQASES